MVDKGMSGAGILCKLISHKPVGGNGRLYTVVFSLGEILWSHWILVT